MSVLRIRKDGTVGTGKFNKFVLGDDKHITTRTILIVEIKSELTYGPNIWWQIWNFQVKAQAHHTFKSHTDLDCLGVIIAVGHRWVYVNVHRPPPDGLTHSQRCDPDYLPSPRDWSDTSSDATIEAILMYVEELLLLLTCYVEDTS